MVPLSTHLIPTKTGTVPFIGNNVQRYPYSGDDRVVRPNYNAAQIYISQVNWTLMIATLGLVLGFRGDFVCVLGVTGRALQEQDGSEHQAGA